MAKLYHLSGDELTIPFIISWRANLRDSINLNFSSENPNYSSLFDDSASEKLEETRLASLKELDLSASFLLMSAIEAKFRIDFYYRTRSKNRVPLAREFKELERRFDVRIRMKEHIIAAWRREFTQLKTELDDFQEAIPFRDWFAHGRYKTPPKGRIDHDFLEILTVARNLDRNADFLPGG